MPAVTVERIDLLPRIDPTSVSHLREPTRVTTARSSFEGDGFPVRRAFTDVPLSQLDPFIHMDQMGEVEYAPGEPKGTPWHPHRGFETVTYMMDGAFVHRDSNGGGGVITNGDTQWMTAGSGILHIERPPEELVMSGGLFHGIQLWVNLPSGLKWSPPRYQDIGASAVTLVASQDGASLVRIIAGQVEGFAGPGVTHTPITLVHATIPTGHTLLLPWNPRFNALVYGLSGSGSVGENTALSMGQLAVLGAGDALRMTATATPDSRTPSWDVLILGGEPIGEEVAWSGPFVMNTHAELATAFSDFRAGKLGTIPADTVE